MSESNPVLAQKQVLVVSDSAALARLLAAELRLRLGLAPVTRLLDDPPAADPTPCDLLLLALSAPDSEPLVALGRSGQAPRLGQFPVLVLSDRPFAPRDHIVHLEFPCPPARLCAQVRALLAGEEEGGNRSPTD